MYGTNFANARSTYTVTLSEAALAMIWELSHGSRSVTVAVQPIMAPVITENLKHKPTTKTKRKVQ
jgi:hypothetical protein